MASPSQKQALRNYRERLGQSGMGRFEVVAPKTDRDLIRSVARRLAGDGPEADRLRTAIRQAVNSEVPTKGGVLAALRRSPLVGVELELVREQTSGRQIDL